MSPNAVPKSIAATDEKFAQSLHEEWQSLVVAISNLETTDEMRAELIESACRILWDLWNDEEKREAMGWASWEDLFNPHQEELATFFRLIDDRITLGNPSNQQRFYNLLLIDSDPTLSELHLLRRRHWTPITQFESRISRLKALLNEPDGEEKLQRAKEIVEPTPVEKPDPEPGDGDWELKRGIGYWRGKKAIRLENDESLFTRIFQARLSLVKPFFVLKKTDCRIIATSDNGVQEVGTVLLAHADPDYLDLLEWLSKRIGVKSVG
jgi:hypothetical protein